MRCVKGGYIDLRYRHRRVRMDGERRAVEKRGINEVKELDASLFSALLILVLGILVAVCRFVFQEECSGNELESRRRNV